MKKISSIFINIITSTLAGVSAILGSYIFVSAIISVYASILAFKEKGTPNIAELDLFVAHFIPLGAPLSSCFFIFLAVFLLQLKWPHLHIINCFILCIVAIISANFLNHHFGSQLQINFITVLFWLASMISGLLGFWLSMRIQHIAKHKKDNKLSHILRPYQLTNREQEIVKNLLSGKSNKQIGNDLFIEEGTVKIHLKSIYKKTTVNSRVELITLLQKEIYSS